MASIFIGIGGTGDWVLTNLKEKVRAAYGEVPKHIQFRLLDTLAPDQRNNTAARLGNKVGIGPTEYLQLADQQRVGFYELAKDIAENSSAKPHVSRWFKAGLFTERVAQADFNLVRGAGQHRQFGRMGMFLNKQQVMTMVRRALDDCGGRDGGETAIWIVGSVAGGTGAGTFLDMALLARQAASGGLHRVLGVAVLPSVFGDVIRESDPTYRYEIARAYAVMREIARFQAPVNASDWGRDAASRQSFRFAVDYDEATRALQDGQLFDSLVFYDQTCASENDRRNYFSQIADGLSLVLDPAVGNKLFASWINAEEGYAASFNSHRVFLPARLFEHLFRAEAVLKVVDGLLPLEGGGTPKAGSLQDRRQEAEDVLEQQSGLLLNRLARLRERADFERLDQDLTPQFIIDNLLGFNNAEATYGADATFTVKEQAKKLHWSLSEGIAKLGDKDNPDNFETSKESVVKQLVSRRNKYEGDGAGSFHEALQALRPVVRKRMDRYIDEALAACLRRHPATSEGLGRFIIVRNELGQLLNQCRERVQRLGQDHRARYQALQGAEAIARQDLETTKKPMFGKGELPQRQQDLFDAVDKTEIQWQRTRLMEWLEELIANVQERLEYWQEKTTEWQRALDGLRQESLAAAGDIHEELARHTQTIQSSSLGITNRPDMDGYREELNKRCLVDPQTGAALPQLLLGGLEWRWDTAAGLTLNGWPGRPGPLLPRDLYPSLRQALDAPISENMRRHEGMAKYLEWLRDVRQGNDLGELGNRLIRATRDFVDRLPTAPNRRFLLLHGDTWNPQINPGEDAFLRVYNQLITDANIGHGNLEHNLRDADGRILFRDKNTIALLVTDNRIDYRQIPVMVPMRRNYLDVRRDDESRLPWRTQAYHLFRCEQEAWEIERWKVRQPGERDSLPLLAGEYYRVLDEPERVKLFAQALVVGVVRQIEVDIGQKEWVCSPVDAANPVWLTEGGGDLFRALVTFVQDKKDRRRDYQGELRPELVKNWIQQAIAAKPLAESLAAFRAAHAADWLDHGAVDGERFADPRRAFMALALGYYLRDA